MLNSTLSLAALAMIAALSNVTRASAQQIDASLVIGHWNVTANYDEFADGRRRSTWGPHPVGRVEFSSNGLFSAQLMGVDRAPKAGTVPTDPVGPALAYYGTYELNAKDGLFVTHVLQSTWPQWNGATLTRKITELTDTTLKVVSAPIKDPQGGEFQPHLEFERIR